MRRWETSDALTVGFVLAVAALLVLSSSCFGLGVLVMLRGGLPAVLARQASDPGTELVAGPAAGSPTPEIAPTFVPVASATPRPTQTPALPPTAVPAPTQTSSLPAAPAAPLGGVVIVEVNKIEEWVTLRNVESAVIDLAGWKIVGENGRVSCPLAGVVIRSNQVARVWTRAQDAKPGDATCGLNGEMWKDGESDSTALYDNLGRLRDRYPHP